MSATDNSVIRIQNIQSFGSAHEIARECVDSNNEFVDALILFWIERLATSLVLLVIASIPFRGISLLSRCASIDELQPILSRLIAVLT